jgi:hypothetical protein
MLPVILWGLRLSVTVRAQVTVYGQIPLAFTQTLPSGARPTVLPAYDETVLIPPPPTPAQSTTFTLTLPTNGADALGLSIVHHDGSFLGFSIEMSVITQVGKLFRTSCFHSQVNEKFSWQELVGFFNRSTKNHSLT